MNKPEFQVLQSSTPRAGDLWDWCLWIEPLRTDRGYGDVEAVTYGLHPAFPNPNRIMRTPGNRFRLDMSSTIAQDQTWGRFEVSVSIKLARGKREEHRVILNLRLPDEAKNLAPPLLPL